jgi:ATP-binding cassette subfamily B protein
MNKKLNIPVKQYFELLRSYMRPQLVKVICLSILLLISISLQLYNPLILRDFIDTAVDGGAAVEKLLALALMFTFIAILNQVISVGGSYLGEYIGWRATNEMRSDLADHCLRLDMSFHKEHTSGEMIERIDGDVNAMSNFFSQFVVKFLSNLVLLVGVLVLLFHVEWRIGLGMLVFVIVTIFVMSRIREFAAPYWMKVSVVRADFYGFLGEHLAGTEDTRSNGATGYVMNKFYALLRSWLPIQLKAGLAGFAMWMSSLFIFALAHALVLLLGGYLWSTGAITIGTVYVVFYYTDLISRPIEQIRTQLEDLQRADASIMRISELFGIQSKLQDGSRSDLPSQALSVQFKEVTFRYDTDESVLDRISFYLGEQKVLGLLGRTGSGKTTLARLLLRFYDVSEGEIALGKVPIQDVAIHTLRQRVGIVTQDIQIFHASVRDNLTFYDVSIPDERIMEVLYDIGLGVWYSSLPDGLDTEMTAGGAGLSAGESQLLAFARVFMKDPGLVILDEASSRLDPATESLIEQAVSKLLKGRTAIIIAHRLSTIKRADEILILEQGHIVEYGNRIMLERDDHSRYSKLQAFGLGEHSA